MCCIDESHSNKTILRRRGVRLRLRRLSKKVKIRSVDAGLGPFGYGDLPSEFKRKREPDHRFVFRLYRLRAASIKLAKALSPILEPAR